MTNNWLCMNCLQHLKVYIEHRLNVNPDAAKICVSERLSKFLYLQKKQLLPFYKKARSENKKKTVGLSKMAIFTCL